MLKQIGPKTYYIENDTNVGIYKTSDDTACLIDTGSKGFGEKIDEILMKQGWKPEFIINTHTHIDHIGGNKYLMDKYGIPAYCTDIEKTFAEYSDLEASYMNGGRPSGKLRHIFAHPGKIGFKAINCPLHDLELLELPGHTFGMIGVKTPDDVWFLGDAYLSKAYMQKRSFGYLTDAEKYMETLEMMKGLEGKVFVPAHGPVEEDIREILELNLDNQRKLISATKEACESGAGLDQILKKMYSVTMLRNTEANHALLSSTVKCYLTYLQDLEEIRCEFKEDMMVWKTV